MTLSSFKAVSADENWIEAFIQNSSEGVRKVSTTSLGPDDSISAERTIARSNSWLPWTVWHSTLIRTPIVSTSREIEEER